MTTTKPAKKAAAKPRRKASPKPAETPPAATPVDEPPAAPLEPVRQAGPLEPLPGMEDTDVALLANLEVAVRRTIAALHGMGFVEEMHAAHTAAAIELAQIITEKHKTGRMSTVGNDMRAMIDLLDRLVPKRDDDGIDAGLRGAMEEWSKANEL